MSAFGHDACICPAGPCQSCAAAQIRAAKRARRAMGFLLAAGLSASAALLVIGLKLSGPGGLDSDPYFAAARTSLQVN